MLKGVRILLFFIGFLVTILSLFMLWKRSDPSRLQFKSANIFQENIKEADKVAIGIAIADINLNLPIIPAHKNGNSWETTPNGVSYLVSSPLPGDYGNTIMYGHNWGSILGNLYKVKAGNKIEIYYSDGSKTEFEIKKITEVWPDDAALLASTDEPTLTLYTCSGIFDQKRLVVTASLI